MAHRVKVECRFVIEVEIDMPIEELEFYVEENSCPGTGRVGSALEEHMAAHEAASTCWACALQGENKILEIDGKPVSE
jgi:hypothetical protein